MLGFLVLGGLICMLLLIPLIILIVVGIWVYRDAKERGMNGALWALLVILGTLFGLIPGLLILIIYLVVRKEKAPAYHGNPPEQKSY